MVFTNVNSYPTNFPLVELRSEPYCLLTRDSVVGNDIVDMLPSLDFIVILIQTFELGDAPLLNNSSTKLLIFTFPDLPLMIGIFRRECVQNGISISGVKCHFLTTVTASPCE